MAAIDKKSTKDIKVVKKDEKSNKYILNPKKDELIFQYPRHFLKNKKCIKDVYKHITKKNNTIYYFWIFYKKDGNDIEIITEQQVKEFFLNLASRINERPLTNEGMDKIEKYFPDLFTEDDSITTETK